MLSKFLSRFFLSFGKILSRKNQFEKGMHIPKTDSLDKIKSFTAMRKMKEQKKNASMKPL